jgi:hypothetical protein
MAMMIDFAHLTAVKSYRHKTVLRHIFIINITIKTSDYEAEVFRPEALFINTEEGLLLFSAVFILGISAELASAHIIFIVFDIFWANPGAVDTMRAGQIIFIVCPVRYSAHRDAYFLYIVHIKEERRLKIYIAYAEFFKSIEVIE